MINKITLSLFAIAIAAGASAQFILEDGNSTLSVDPTSTQPTFLRGANSWMVDGVEQMFNQWYWYRVGETTEKTIDTISAPVVTMIAGNSANVKYASNTFTIDLTLTLIGGSSGSGTADLSEVIRITNHTNSDLDFHLFEYDDFDIGGTFADDTAIRFDSSSIVQGDATGSVHVGAVPPANRWQISEVPVVFDLLNDGVASNLSNSGSGTGPADVAFGFQWDRSIAAGGTFLMSKNKVVTTVPEPATLGAIALGLAAFLKRRKK